MKKTILFSILTISLVFMSCGPRVAPEAAPEAAPKAEVAAPVKAVSDGSEDLVIDWKVSLSGDESVSYFNWKSNIRYMAAEDSYDAVSGASALGSTHLFMSCLYDIEAKATMSTGLRGLFLYGVAGDGTVKADNLNASKSSDGTIVIQYVHRGTAFRFTTDSKGVMSLPKASIDSRKIGDPKAIEAEFSSDGKATGVDFDKVWSKDIVPSGASPEAMYVFDGDLQFTLENDVLAASGVLTAVRQ